MGTRSPRQRHSPYAMEQHRSPLHLDGRGGLAHFFRCSGPFSQRKSHRPHRWRRCDQIRRLAAIERRICKTVWRRAPKVAASGGSKVLNQEVSLNWNKWIRKTHRWLSIAFTLAVIANGIAVARGKYTNWLGLLA